MCIATETQHNLQQIDYAFKNTNQRNNIPLDVSWDELKDVKYLTCGGGSNVYKAIFRGTPSIIKLLKPELAEDETFMNEMESEIKILCKLDHPNIVQLYGAGYNSKQQRFIILEQLNGGTMEKIFEGNSKNIMRSKSTLSFKDVVTNALAMANAIKYIHSGIDGCTILHRDLKPDNIGFTADGILKIMDFGLASVIESTGPYSDDIYEMTGGTGSLRYMAPEVADTRPYNHKCDVYSFSILLWELLSCKKPYAGLSIDDYYDQVVYGGVRPNIESKWNKELTELMTKCWDAEHENRPNSQEIVTTLESIGAAAAKVAPSRRKLSIANIKRRTISS